MINDRTPGAQNSWLHKSRILGLHFSGCRSRCTELVVFCFANHMQHASVPTHVDTSMGACLLIHNATYVGMWQEK